MQKKEVFKTRRIYAPVLGLNQASDATTLIDGTCPVLQNFCIEPSYIRKRLGYTTLGVNLPLTGAGMHVCPFIDGDGVRHMLALTSRGIFEYSGSTLNWMPLNIELDVSGVGAIGEAMNCTSDSWWVGGSASSADGDTTLYKQGSASIKITTLATTATDVLLASTGVFTSKDISTSGLFTMWIYTNTPIPANSLSIVFSPNPAGAKTGDYVEFVQEQAIAANTWVNLTANVDVTSATNIMSIGVYANVSFEVGTEINIDDMRLYTPFTGTASDLWKVAIHSDPAFDLIRAFVITNGVDDMMYWTGASGTAIAPMPVTTFETNTLVSVDEIASFQNHFLVANYYSGVSAKQHSNMVAWADYSDYDDWSGGTSGAILLADSIGSIFRMEKISNQLAIYSEGSISVLEFIGGTFVFRESTPIIDTGLITKNALYPSSNAHYFVGTDQKLYAYQGGRELSAIGEQITKKFFSLFDPSKKNKVLVTHDLSTHKIMFMFPTAVDDYARNFYTLNYSTNPITWEFGRFGHDVVYLSDYTLTTSLTCQNVSIANTPCSSLTMKCSDGKTQSENILPICITAQGYVYVLSRVIGLDDAEYVEAIYETLDDVQLNDNGRRVFFRTIDVQIEACSGLSCDSVFSLYYSTDAGKNWVLLAADVAVGADWETFTYTVDTRSDTIRYKVESLASDRDLWIKDIYTRRTLGTTRE